MPWPGKVRRLWRMLRRLGPEPPRPWRPEWLPADFPLRLESKVHPHVREERAELFMAQDTGSTEVEILNWLHASICLMKPASIVETGAARGLGTIALASACRSNAFGHVHSIELDPEVAETVRARLAAHGLAEWATVHTSDSHTFLSQTTERFDFGFFDSVSPIRPRECEICLERGILTGFAAFHDTSALRPRSYPDLPPEAVQNKYRDDVKSLAARVEGAGFFELKLSRGLMVIYLPTENARLAPRPSG